MYCTMKKRKKKEGQKNVAVQFRHDVITLRYTNTKTWVVPHPPGLCHSAENVSKNRILHLSLPQFLLLYDGCQQKCTFLLPNLDFARG